MLKDVKKHQNMLRNFKTIQNLEIFVSNRPTDRLRCRVACTRLKTWFSFSYEEVGVLNRTNVASYVNWRILSHLAQILESMSVSIAAHL